MGKFGGLSRGLRAISQQRAAAAAPSRAHLRWTKNAPVKMAEGGLASKARAEQMKAKAEQRRERSFSDFMSAVEKQERQSKEDLAAHKESLGKLSGQLTGKKPEKENAVSKENADAAMKKGAGSFIPEPENKEPENPMAAATGSFLPSAEPEPLNPVAAGYQSALRGFAPQTNASPAFLKMARPFSDGGSVKGFIGKLSEKFDEAKKKGYLGTAAKAAQERKEQIERFGSYEGPKARIGDSNRRIKQYEEGGPVSGPGTSTSDSIPALLSDGEYVVKAKVVAKPGMKELLDKINKEKPVAKDDLAKVLKKKYNK
jgi:hypothetical protein